MTARDFRKNRNSLFNKQKGKCYWCKRDMRKTPREHHDPLECTLDHLYPRGHPLRSEQRIDGMRKHVAACRRCNEARGNDLNWKPSARDDVATAD